MLLSLFRPQCCGAVRHQVRLEMMLGAVPTLGSAAVQCQSFGRETLSNVHG